MYVINAGYLFENSFRRLGEFQFVSRTFAGQQTDSVNGVRSGNRFSGTWLGRIPIPVPANYLQGIDVQRRDFECGGYSYLRGEWKDSGWWYYYLYALVVKEPIGMLGLATLAACTVVLRRPATTLSGDLIPLVCGASIFVFVSSQTGFNHHYRYVLPALPLFYVFISRLFSPKRNKLLTVIGTCCVAGSALSSLSTYPHSLSYFNELAGGPAAGPRHLLHSNLDLGQDLLYLKDWCDRHPDRRPLYVVYSGGFIAANLQGWDAGVHHSNEAETLQALLDDHTGPCWYAIFVGCLFDRPECTEKLARFRSREPDERLGYTVYIYRQDKIDAEGQR